MCFPQSLQYLKKQETTVGCLIITLQLKAFSSYCVATQSYEFHQTSSIAVMSCTDDNFLCKWRIATRTHIDMYHYYTHTYMCIHGLTDSRGLGDKECTCTYTMYRIILTCTSCWQLDTPAVCRQQQHHESSSSHHRLSPTAHCDRPPPYPRKGQSHSLGVLRSL